MFLWVTLVLVYPNWSRFSINPVGDTSAEGSSTNQQVQQIWEEVDREERRFLENSPLTGESPRFNLSYSDWNSSWGDRRRQINAKVHKESEPLVSHVQKYNETMETLYIRLAEQTALIRKQNLENTSLRKATWDERLMKLSPSGLYTFATSAWAGTDLDGMLDFVQEVQGYRRIVIDYFHDKNAFGSRQWFASDQGTVDWWDLPQFRFTPVDARENAARALPELFLLLLINLALFTVIFLFFTRIEV